MHWKCWNSSDVTLFCILFVLYKYISFTTLWPSTWYKMSISNVPTVLFIFCWLPSLLVLACFQSNFRINQWNVIWIYIFLKLDWHYLLYIANPPSQLAAPSLPIQKQKWGYAVAGITVVTGMLFHAFWLVTQLSSILPCMFGLIW